MKGNALNGTCQLGQLLMKGYDQELRNGAHLREAYFYDGDDADGTSATGAAIDPRMRLWDYSNNATNDADDDDAAAAVGDPTKPAFLEPNVRYRADDEQRTLMSGQVLLRGLFERELLAAQRREGGKETAIIRLHTADYDMDVLTPHNPGKCPRTSELRREAYDSDEYARWIESIADEREHLTKSAYGKMGFETTGGEEGELIVPDSLLDCMMTTMCTDRSLPDYLDDYDGSLGPTPFSSSGEGGGTADAAADRANVFERIVNLAVKNFTFAYKYNDAAYPKLGMGPLWYEIMTNILPIVDPTYRTSSSLSSSSGRTPPPKLGLFSGHAAAVTACLSLKYSIVLL